MDHDGLPSLGGREIAAYVQGESLKAPMPFLLRFSTSRLSAWCAVPIAVEGDQKMTDPKKQPDKYARSTATTLDILQSILRDAPGSGIHIEADAAANLAEALRVIAQGMQHVESLTLRVQMRKAKAA